MVFCKRCSKILVGSTPHLFSFYLRNRQFLSLYSVLDKITSFLPPCPCVSAFFIVNRGVSLFLGRISPPLSAKPIHFNYEGCFVQFSHHSPILSCIHLIWVISVTYCDLCSLQNRTEKQQKKILSPLIPSDTNLFLLCMPAKSLQCLTVCDPVWTVACSLLC